MSYQPYRLKGRECSQNLWRKFRCGENESAVITAILFKLWMNQSIYFWPGAFLVAMDGVMHKKDRKQTCLLQSRWMRVVCAQRPVCVCVYVCVCTFICVCMVMCVHDKETRMKFWFRYNSYPFISCCIPHCTVKNNPFIHLCFYE